MGEDEVREEARVAKNIDAWRQSERKVMIDTVQDLIQTSHKYAKSQYTPSAQRARWAKLAGQLIWYKDQILKNFSLEAMAIEVQALKKRVIESEERRERERRTGKYSLLSHRRPAEKKTEAEESSEALDAEDSDGAKERVTSST